MRADISRREGRELVTRKLTNNRSDERVPELKGDAVATDGPVRSRGGISEPARDVEIRDVPGEFISALPRAKPVVPPLAVHSPEKAMDAGDVPVVRLNR